jgi:hypothetical protein
MLALQGFPGERMKGLEPSTFCMASSRFSRQKPGFSLQTRMISALGAMPADRVEYGGVYVPNS